MRTARLTHVLSVCLLCVCVGVPLLGACVVCIRPASSQALRSGQDLFIVAASDLFGKPQSAVTADDRGVAKRAIYGILYGLGVYELAERLGVDVASASAFALDEDGFEASVPAFCTGSSLLPVLIAYGGSAVPKVPSWMATRGKCTSGANC